MIHARARSFHLALGLALIFGVHAPAQTAPPAPDAPRLVVLLSIDGLRPDAIEAAGAVVLQRLIREGAYCPTAQTIFPSATLPSHTSMFTGVTLSKHKVIWNAYLKGGVIARPTVLDLATRAGLECALAAGKEKFYHFKEGHELKTYIGPTPDGGGDWGAQELTPKAIEYVKEKRPRLLVLHYKDPDSAGHKHGWMSEEQWAAIRECDAALGTMLAFLDADAEYRGNTTLIVSADHGGHDRTHGSKDPVDMTIPWIAWGARVAPGTVLKQRVRTYDTAATVLVLLGLEVPEDWDGRPVLTALDAAQTAPVAEDLQESGAERR